MKSGTATMHSGTNSIGITSGQCKEITVIGNILAAFVLSFSLMFSSNAFGAVDLIKCRSSDNLQEYNELHQMIKEGSKSLEYDLGITSLCIGKEEEAMPIYKKLPIQDT